MIKYIERDLSMRPVTDFKMHVQPNLTFETVAEEVYEGNLLIGWRIVKLKNGGIL